MPEVMGVHGAAMEFLARLYQGVFGLRIRTVAVGTTPIEIAQSDAERVWIGFYETSGATFILYPDHLFTGVTGFNGTPGGNFTFSVDKDSLLPCVAWYGGASAAAVLFVIECYRTHKLTKAEVEQLYTAE
jgi:hypothetical protein